MGQSTRKVTKLGNLAVTTNDNDLIIDNDCDQTIINKSDFNIDIHIGILYHVGEALGSMSSSNLELVGSVYTLVHFQSNKLIFGINQDLLDMDPLQIEALLQPHQTRAFGLSVDGCLRCHIAANSEPGGQCIGIGEDKFPFHFDG